MTDMPAHPAPASASSRVEMPRALPFLLNVALAAGLGGFLGGWAGALAGAGALFLLLAAFFLAPAIVRLRHALGRVGAAIWTLLRPLFGLLLLPPVALIALGASLLILAWERTVGRLSGPAVPAALAPLRLLGRVRDLLFGLLKPENLPMTSINVLLLLVLGCVAIGIQVAFYAALAAVPVMICTLMMVAVESSREPEDGPAKG